MNKKEILGKLKTNLAPNKRNELLRTYNSLSYEDRAHLYFAHKYLN